MSKIEIKPFEEQIRIAGIAGELERAEDKGREEGYANGCAETEEKFISRLLETRTPDDISREFDVPIERVVEIKNSNS